MKEQLDYERMPKETLLRLLIERLPNIMIISDEINEYNRNTLIAFLKISEGEYL